MMPRAFCLALTLVFLASQGSATTLYTVNRNGGGSDPRLVAIDTDTLQMQEVGPIGANFWLGDVAYDSTTSTLYMIDGSNSSFEFSNPSPNNRSLYTLDLSTGQATQVGNHGVENLQTLAFDEANGVLLATRAAGPLYEVSPADGSAAFRRSLSQFVQPNGLEYNRSSGEIILAQDVSGPNTGLWELQLSGGGPDTQIFSGPLLNIRGLAYDASENVYWLLADGSLFSYDVDAGFARTTEIDGTLNGYYGLTSVPEPGTGVLLASGLLALSIRGKRQRGTPSRDL